MIETKDWLVVGATLFSPLVAVQVSVWLQNRKEKRERRFQVFRNLMSTRAANLHPSHVEALNMIDVAFYGSDKRSKAVFEALKVYLDHLDQPTSNAGWGDKRVDLLIDLLQKMAASLGYDFDKITIKRTSYFPKSFGDTDFDALLLRKGILQLLEGKRALPMWLSGVTPQDASTQQHATQQTISAQIAIDQAAPAQPNKTPKPAG